MTRTTMKVTALLIVLSIGFVKTTEDGTTGEANNVCVISNARIEHVQMSYANAEYRAVKRVINDLEHKIDMLSPGDSQSTATVHAQPQDCSQISSTKSGIYKIQPAECPQHFRAFCDMETEGGGWTVIQRREDGSIGFNRGWKDYQQGFGNKKSEYWLGNENLFWLTAQKRYELRVELTDFNDEMKYAEYDKFRVGDKGNRYKLLIGTYRNASTAGDALSHHNNAAFTTSNYDNDGASTGNCAGYFLSGWWYTDCFHANLNGLYRADGEQQDVRGIVWSAWRGLNISMKAVQMKIRPVSTTLN